MSTPAHDHRNPSRPSRSLEGRVAIVTGAGSRATGIGNGRAASILLAEAGARVVCVDMNLEWAEVTVSMIAKEFGKDNVIALQADVTEQEACKRAVDTAVQKFGRLDILVNNVGVGGPQGTAVGVDQAEWAKGLEINVTSMMLMAKYAIPAMERNERHPIGGRGSIINIASVAGVMGGTPMLLYPTSKGAVVNMTRAMAVHHAPSGIRVNCVCPGMLYTPMLYVHGMPEEVREARRNRSLLKTEGNGWDCGCAVRFLASDEARWMTGVILPVDAGSTAAPAGDGMSQGMSSTLAGGIEKAKL
ncbi:short-chain dehydrogenase/reductase SDR [Flammula alnicola]|nr:short-chain dehydrogenase/reductase SDR [Flammula alnicola]KAF8965593.1 short-chain dehydrogenase/reductase SDR [Flammula alnicola]